MLQLRGGFDFCEKPLGAECGGEIGVEDFDCDVAVVSQVVSEVDGRHSAHADFPVDAISIGEGSAEFIEGVGLAHGEDLTYGKRLSPSR